MWEFESETKWELNAKENFLITDQNKYTYFKNNEI